jgi:hypothetical protein
VRIVTFVLEARCSAEGGGPQSTELQARAHRAGAVAAWIRLSSWQDK